MIKLITSVHNPLIKEVAKLQENRERHEKGQFIAEGLRSCATIIAAGMRPLLCFVLREKLHEAAQLLGEQDPIIVSPQIMNKISATSSPSGVLMVFPIPNTPKDFSLESGLVLVDIADPGNMGTLLRSCAAMGKKTVVIVGGADPFHPKTVQASAGTIASVSLRSMNWEQLLERAKRDGISLCALVVKGGSKPSEIRFENTLLVVGNEAHGLSQTQINSCEKRVTLSMPGGTESLNAAVAGSIALYLAAGLQ